MVYLLKDKLCGRAGRCHNHLIWISVPTGAFSTKPLTLIEKKTNPPKVYYFFTVVYLNTIKNSHQKTQTKSHIDYRSSCHSCNSRIFFFLYGKCYPLMQIKASSKHLIFFNFFLQNMSFFAFLIHLDLTYFVIGQCFVWGLF